MYLASFIALVGSLLFSYFEIPLGAMFGALIALLVTAKAGFTLALPKSTLTGVQLILGATVGSIVPVQTLSKGYPILLFVGLVLCMSAQVLTSYLWLSKREKWSKYESLLGAVPGAMAAVLVINENHNSPSSKVIFTHTVRLIFLIIASALLVSTDNSPVPGPAISLDNLWILLPLFLAYFSGLLLDKIGTPAPYMVTGMLATMFVNSELPSYNFLVPTELVFIATSALGALIGIRLKDITVVDIFSYARAGIIATTLSLTVTVVFAYIFSKLIDKEFIVLLMSWVPGSVESMTVAAIYLGLEPALIMLSHIIRMVMLHSIPLGFNIYKYLRRQL
ncbi:TPA: AbrB family transcriptional regulator [Vibrio vulnificus]|uniref:AbrB family transcriptional regulator n=1 Tax=Vibrio crassostreae TaxID=246167 RepID=UPI0028C09ED6|nr:AbrB family transcriptional regulator [Vibrio vulnificus]HDY8021189.1 AbrB family transcriptional regulator [Vibrio vulnificus]